MILWSIQKKETYETVLKEGVWRCDPEKIFLPESRHEYEWLAKEMSLRIGPPPAGVTLPVWAWHTIEGKRKRPDLRKERFGNGVKGDRFVCLTLDIPDEQVLLSDFDAWSVILADGLISETEEEDDQLYAVYEALPDDEKESMKSSNWERAFNLSPFHNEWMTRGQYIQATFWELKEGYIREVRHFMAG